MPLKANLHGSAIYLNVTVNHHQVLNAVLVTDMIHEVKNADKWSNNSERGKSTTLSEIEKYCFVILTGITTIC